MRWVFRNKVTPVWVLLFFATCLSWVLGTYRVAGPGMSQQLAGIAVMLIAMIKIRFVLIHFMELKRAPWIWRALFETWVAFLSIALVTTYLLI